MDKDWSVRFVWGGYAFEIGGPVLPATESVAGPFATGEEAMKAARETFVDSITFPNPRRILSDAYLRNAGSETPLSLTELRTHGEVPWERE